MERETAVRETSIGCFSHAPGLWLGIKPATKVLALDQNQAQNSSVHKPTL